MKVFMRLEKDVVDKKKCTISPLPTMLSTILINVYFVGMQLFSLVTFKADGMKTACEIFEVNERV